ncbi:MAG: VacB/RNase II family 3'-5' exoribonuclease [Acidobacteriota bacterium]|nr:VacB/RNase II family 3'-5' exoribonuclease [Acidobacteriota bacterium]
MKDGVLLQHILKLPHGKANLKQLARELHAKGPEREKLDASLERLVERGELIALRAGHYSATARGREFAAGRISMHRDGFGFLIPDRKIDGVTGDIFIPANATRAAMNGDRAVARIKRIESDGKADGEIIKILKRAHPTVVGEFRIGQRGFFVVPQDERLRGWIEIPDDLALPSTAAQNRIGAAPVTVGDVADLDGMIVNVEVLEFAGQGRHEDAVGRVIEILGHPGDFGVDVEIIIRKHHLPHQFPAEVLIQAQNTPAIITREELRRRRDFREMPVVTIDGETARDFDDAVWVDRLENGHFALHVHIADVSHYVRPGSPIDEEAKVRGTSVYFPDRAIPMLPFELSTDICSLKPQADRLVLSALMEFDRQGELVSQDFCRGVIRSAERMTYTNVHLLLEGDLAQRERYAPLVPRFEMMQELALILNRKRDRRGSIDFDMPEAKIEFDDLGAMTGVKKADRNIANRLIEEFMLAANEAVAAHLEQHAPASIYRIHELPDPKRVMDFEEVARHFKVSLGIATPVKQFSNTERNRDGSKIRRSIATLNEPIRISSRNYQKLVKKIEGLPEERILSYLMLRSLKQARYSTVNVGHFALAADFYTHFTSPIRRYPDLIVHRLLGALFDKTAVPNEDGLQAIAEACSLTERRAAEAERELVEWKKVKFMKDRLGEEFQALVISTAKYGLFVELEDLFIEGLVPIESLPGDRYQYYENVRKIIGQRSRRQFSIGDEVRVALDRVEPAERRLQFSLVEPEPQRRKKKR